MMFIANLSITRTQSPFEAGLHKLLAASASGSPSLDQAHHGDE